MCEKGEREGREKRERRGREEGRRDREGGRVMEREGGTERKKRSGMCRDGDSKRERCRAYLFSGAQENHSMRRYHTDVDHL